MGRRGLKDTSKSVFNTIETLGHYITEVKMYDEIHKQMKEYKEEGPTNLTWSEGDTWYGWTYDSNAKRYYFDDIGNESLMGLWEDQWAREEAESK